MVGEQPTDVGGEIWVVTCIRHRWPLVRPLMQTAALRLGLTQLATVFEDPHTVLRVPEVTERAIRAGAMPEGSTRAWLERLTSKPFLASATLWLTFGRR